MTTMLGIMAFQPSRRPPTGRDEEIEAKPETQSSPAQTHPFPSVPSHHRDTPFITGAQAQQRRSITRSIN
jgi:hypothetical protein